MRSRKLGWVSATLLVFACTALQAREPDAMLEVRRLQTLIAVINAEIKADLDQAMTLRQINTVNARKPVEVQGFSPDPISYDDLVEAQRRTVQTEAAISLRLEAILARGIALNAEKQPLLDRVKDLLGAPR